MSHNLELPDRILTTLGPESRDFAVKAKRAQPVKSTLGLVLFGTFWLAFTSIFVIAFLGPLFVGREVHFTSNDVPVVAGPDNLGPIVVPALIIGLFVLVGIGLLGFGLAGLFRKGGFFVGTPTRLILSQGNRVRSIDWEQFSGDIEMSGTAEKGNLTLGMRTGRMVSRKNGPDQYVPDRIYMAGIPDIVEVERKCRQRIKENDPTPSVT